MNTRKNFLLISFLLLIVLTACGTRELTKTVPCPHDASLLCDQYETHHTNDVAQIEVSKTWQISEGQLILGVGPAIKSFTYNNMTPVGNNVLWANPGGGSVTFVFKPNTPCNDTCVFYEWIIRPSTRVTLTPSAIPATTISATSIPATTVPTQIPAAATSVPSTTSSYAIGDDVIFTYGGATLCHYYNDPEKWEETARKGIPSSTILKVQNTDKIEITGYSGNILLVPWSGVNCWVVVENVAHNTD